MDGVLRLPVEIARVFGWRQTRCWIRSAEHPRILRVISIASTVEEWQSAIEAGLNDNSAARISERVQVAVRILGRTGPTD